MFSSENTSVRNNDTKLNNSNNSCCNNVSRVDASKCSNNSSNQNSHIIASASRSPPGLDMRTVCMRDSPLRVAQTVPCTHAQNVHGIYFLRLFLEL